ncbi:hypothetical protein D3C78_1691380 [compost metagenome]
MGMVRCEPGLIAAVLSRRVDPSPVEYGSDGAREFVALTRTAFVGAAQSTLNHIQNPRISRQGTFGRERRNDRMHIGVAVVWIWSTGNGFQRPAVGTKSFIQGPVLLVVAG